jgi:hypothetical protein
MSSSYSPTVPIDWIPEAKSIVKNIQHLLTLFFSKLAKSSTPTIFETCAFLQQIGIENERLNQFRPFIDQYLRDRELKIEMMEKVKKNHSKITKKLLLLTYLRDEISTELQTYPYTRPENVRDDLTSIITNPALTAQSLSTSHLEKIGPNNSTNKSRSKSVTLAPFNPTAPVDTILYMSRQLQYYRDIPYVQNDMRRSNYAFPAALLHQGLLIKPPQELVSSLHLWKR